MTDADTWDDVLAALEHHVGAQERLVAAGDVAGLLALGPFRAPAELPPAPPEHRAVLRGYRSRTGNVERALRVRMFTTSSTTALLADLGPAVRRSAYVDTAV